MWKSRTSSVSCLPAVSAKTEGFELGLAVAPVVRARPEQQFEVVEVGLLDGIADLVASLEVARQPEQCAQLVADERVVGGNRPQHPHQVPVAHIGSREAGLGHLHGGQVEAEMLGPGLGGEKVGLAAPLQIRHQVRGWRGLAQGVAAMRFDSVKAMWCQRIASRSMGAPESSS